MRIIQPCYPRMAVVCILDQLTHCKIGPLCALHDRWLIKCMADDAEDFYSLEFPPHQG